MQYLKSIFVNVERAVRAVLKNPWLLFGLMAASLLARMLFARPNREESR